MGKVFHIFIVFSLIVNSLVIAQSVRHGRDNNAVESLQQLLFPNRTIESKNTNSARRLQTVPCTVCQGLKTCSVLNGYQIQETYYPNNLNFLQTCKVIDDLGDRLEPLIFGIGRTFRDTEQCRGNLSQLLLHS